LSTYLLTHARTQAPKIQRVTQKQNIKTGMAQKNDILKKRCFVSPQKAQASIKAFTANKPLSKKANSNKSPHRQSSPLLSPLPESPPSVKGRSALSSPLSRSFLAIVPTQKSTTRLEPDKSRNFFDPIAPDEDEDSKTREASDNVEGQDQEREKNYKGSANYNDQAHQDSPQQQQGIRTMNLEQEGQAKASSSDMSEEPPLTLQEKIAIARALLSDASVLAEMNVVMEDKEKVEMLRHISTSSNKEQPDLSNDYIQRTDEPNMANLSQDAVMEEQDENGKSSSPSVSFSPETVITPKPRRTPKHGRCVSDPKASFPERYLA